MLNTLKENIYNLKRMYLENPAHNILASGVKLEANYSLLDVAKQGSSPK